MGRKYDIPHEYILDLATLSDEPAVCARFGCGNKLSITEQLYGNYCFECAGTSQVIGQKKVDNLWGAVNKAIILKLK